jgi:hypothetical protein
MAVQVSATEYKPLEDKSHILVTSILETPLLNQKDIPWGIKGNENDNISTAYTLENLNSKYPLFDKITRVSRIAFQI